METRERLMLVLTRKLGESIVIDGNIVVEVVQIEGQRVRLGISAPRDIPVRRSELGHSTVAAVREEQNPLLPAHA